MDVADGSIQDVLRAIGELNQEQEQRSDWLVKIGAALSITSFFLGVTRSILASGVGVESSLEFGRQICLALLHNTTDGGIL